MQFRPVGREVQSGLLEPHFCPTKDLIHHHISILSALPSVSGPLDSLPLIITTVKNEFGCSYAPCLFMENQWINAEPTCKWFMPLQ